MTATLGMDTVAGRQAGEQLAHGSAQIAELAQRLDTVVMALEWAGMDAERYRSDWRDLQRPTLDATARLLSEVAALIRGEAEAQDQRPTADVAAVGPSPRRRPRAVAAVSSAGWTGTSATSSAAWSAPASRRATSSGSSTTSSPASGTGRWPRSQPARWAPSGPRPAPW